MIGLFGIIAHESILDQQKRNQTFSRMSDDTDHEDFIIEVLSGRHYSIGLIKRAIGENKDLAMKAVGDNLFCAFCGYGKFKGEKRLYWAEDMLDRAAEAFQKEGQEALTLIEGSFQCLILKDNEFLIASDRFSSKIMFYHKDESCFVFAPDVGRVVQSGLVPKIKNLDAAKQVLVSGFFLDDSTLAKGVMRFPYGSLLSCRVSRKLDIEIKQYWEVSEREGSVDEVTPDLVGELNCKIERAIDELAALENRAVVPLSGGLDSRAIAYYVSKRQPLHTITYDLGDEVSISKKVCFALGASRTYFSNEFIQTDDFKIELKRMVEEQRIHAVLNQYFYAPLFRNHFYLKKEHNALYDGIYLDALFNVAYVFYSFGLEDFIKIYGRGLKICGLFSKRIKKSGLLKQIMNIYVGIENFNPLADGIGKSQKTYLNGRLRRYVLESLSFKEDYCYVLKPAFDYKLVDFAYKLSLRLRKGLLYQELFKTFPEIANIEFKDPRGIQKKTLYEKLREKYVKYRSTLAYGSKGIIPYFAYQNDWFFLGFKQIEDYRDMLLKPNYIKELFDDKDIERLFKSVKRKHYLFNLFQRVLFLQQFYRRYEF